MKKIQFLTYLFAALFTITMVSCSDDDDDKDDTITPGKEALLIADTWFGSKVYYQGADFTEQAKTYLDITTVSIEFSESGTYTGNISGDDSETGTWEFTNNDTQIIMDKGTPDELIVDVNRLSTTELWVEGDFLGTNGEETLELRFVH